MRKLQRALQRGGALVVLLVLAACGGGGDDLAGEADHLAGQGEPVASGPTAEQRQATGGSWIGTIGERMVFGFILPDGRHSLLYSPPEDGNMLAGFMQGGGHLTLARFTSQTRSYAFGAPAVDAELAGDVDAQSLVGTAQVDGATAEPLLLKYLAYYNAPPSLQTLAGAYDAQSSFGGAGRFTLSETGELRGGGDPAECVLTGQLTPQEGSHAFAVFLTFEGPACVFPEQSFTGLAFQHPAALQRLYLTVVDEQGSQGLLFMGDRQ